MRSQTITGQSLDSLAYGFIPVVQHFLYVFKKLEFCEK